jgi:altronate dehydratase large subunit
MLGIGYCRGRQWLTDECSKEIPVMEMNWSGLLGYRRPDGRYGVRNRVVVMAAADNVNPLAAQLANAVPGAQLIPATFGRGQLGSDLDATIRALVGLASNPNVAEALIVSFEAESALRILEGVCKRGRAAQYISLIELGGHSAAMERGTKLLTEMLFRHRSDPRVAMPPSSLVVGLECGGSDATSGLVANPVIGRIADSLIDAGGTAIFSEPVELVGCEDALARRARREEIAQEVRALTKRYTDIAAAAGVDLVGVNPTADNLAGGLTTIEEKSLGAVSKSGSRPLQGVLAFAEAPKACGVWLMDAPAAAVENLTALSAGGCQAVLFSSGSVNPSGNPISPTVKICANPRSAQSMREHVDVDLSGVLTEGLSLESAVARAHETLRAILLGRDPKADELGYSEIRISRFGLSV